MKYILTDAGGFLPNSLRGLRWRLAQAHRALGYSRLLPVTVGWLIRPEYLVLTRDLREPLGPATFPPGLVSTSLTEADYPKLTALNPLCSLATIRQRIAEGQQCTLYWLCDRLVHERWDTTLPAYLPYIGKTFQPLEGDLLTTFAYSDPAFSGRGLHSLSTAVTLQRARELGLQRAISIVAWWNAPALKVTLHKARRTPVGRIGYWKLGLRRRYFATGQVCLWDGFVSVRPR